jgi:FixJ family two-component response regulator
LAPSGRPSRPTFSTAEIWAKTSLPPPSGATLLLRQHGYDSVLSPSAKAFENHSDFEKAVCIVLDINLNDGPPGIELRHCLKADGVSVPVVCFTANDNPAVRVAPLQSGCVAHLTKPFGQVADGAAT